MYKLRLKNVAFYSKERVSYEGLDVKTYISTDNLLQNKLGVAQINQLPTSQNNTPKYNIDDILVSNIRPYLKKIFYSKQSGGVSADVLTFTTKKGYHPKFIYYNLFQDFFFEHMMAGSKGTKMPRGDKNQILDFEIPNYCLDKQQKIASVLSALDDKIELNNKINIHLEQMAKAIYDYWFVQFDFPNEHGKPYKSSGGEMEYNKELKREIPKVWEVKELSDISKITMGQSPPGETYNEDGNGTIFYQGCTDFGNRFPTIRKFTTAPTRFAKKGDILLSVRAPVGTLNISKENCCIGRGLAALNSSYNADTFLYGVMENLKQIFDRRNVNGTTFGSITKDDLFSLKVVVPTDDILDRYESAINPSFTKQNIIESQNSELAQLRDWLLPMLMNGQVTVGDAYNLVEEKLGMVAEEDVGYKVNNYAKEI